MFLLYSIIFTGILLSESWSRDTKYCTIEGTIELCAPLEVKGVQGEDVIIPCRFRHNEGGDIKELGLVFKKYYNYKQDVIFNSSSKYTDWRFKGRIQTVGNPSEGDGSVRIRDLKMEDEGMYGCWFVFDQWRSQRWEHVGFEPRSWKRTKVQVDGSRIHNPYNCTMEGTKKLCVQRKVIGVQGEAVVLPCLFNHNEGNNITDLSFVLYKYYNSRYNVIFHSSTNDTHERFKGRIQSLGNPSEGDGSVRIKDLKKEDKGRYKCVFEFDQWEGFWNQWKRVRFEPRPGRRTKVQVDVHAKILKVSKELKNSSNSWTMFCEAEAKPRPNITWLNPNGHSVNGTKTISSPNGQNGLENIISIFNITGEDPEGKYTCLVENKYGQVQDHLIFTTAPAPQSNGSSQWIVVGCSIALSLVLLLLFAVGLHIYRKKQKHSEGNTTQPNVELHESGQRDEASYMVLKKHHDESQSQVYETL